MSNFKTNDIDIWLFRLGHPSKRILEYICKNNIEIHYDERNIRDYCYYAKQHRLCFSDNNSATHDIFELIHIDIWGPLNIAFVHGHRYFLTIVDDFSRHTWVFLMKNESETRFILDNFVIYIRNQFNKCINIMRTYNGSEFNYKELYDKFGIMHQTSCIETP